MNLKKLLSVATLFVTSALGFNANAQADYNIGYKEGVEVAEGENYFLYNLGAKMFLTDGMDYGTHASVDHSGRVITLKKNINGYSIYTKPYSANNGTEERAGYLTLNGYVDTGGNDADWQFTSVIVEGYENVYTIKHSDNQYLFYETKDNLFQGEAGAFINIGENTNNANSYWLLIPITKRQELGDYTYYLQNTDFNHPWERHIWNPANKGDWTNTCGGDKSNTNAEMWHKQFDVNQTISKGIPKGKYTLYNQGFYNDTDNPAFLYANDSESELKKMNANGENTGGSMSGASASFSAGHYMNSVTTIVTDNKLTVGVKDATDGNWVIFDNFFLKCEDLFLSVVATPFTGSGFLEADKWYVYDVINSVAHNFSSIDGIEYTQTDALQGEAITNKAENKVELTAGKLYFKSTVSQELSITPEYYVSKATTGVKYIQKDNVITVSYDVSTTNPEASLKVNFDGVTFDGKAIEITTTSNGFTFTVPEVSANASYILSIPADAIGYEGYLCNDAQEITLNTPAVFDGYYYMYNTETKSYLSRGGVWATSAILDDWGLAVYLKTDVNGNTSIQYFDSKLYLCDDGFCYTDAGENNGRRRYFKVSSADGGYKFLNTNNNKYLAAFQRGNIYNAVGDAVEGGNLHGVSNVWQLVKPADHHAKNYTKNADAQAAATAIAATNADLKGLSEITTVSALDSYLDKLGSESVSIKGDDQEQYQNYAARSEKLVEAEYFKETVKVKSGLYKLSVDAFQRASWNEDVAAAEGARGSIYVYANEAKTQIKSVMEYGADESYGEGWPNYAYNGKNYPNNHTAAKNALKTGNYKNDVYVYVADEGDGTGSLTFGINNPNRLGDDINRGTWAVYNNFTLTYYGTEVKIAVKANKYSTFIAPFDVTIPEGVTASKVTDTEGEILVFEGLEETIPANTPVVLYSENGCEETFIGTDLSTDVTYTVGLLTGTYEESTTVPAGSYVLQTQDNGQKFYLVGANTTFKMPNRAYLTVPTESAGVKAFSFGGETTGINGVETLTDGAVESIFTISGARVNSLQKGLNIVKMSNGKTQKVLVK